MSTSYGVDFPFRDSLVGDFVRMTKSPEEEIRANLIHLILTKKGTRYFLPDFGTRIYEFIFDQNDVVTFSHIEDDIRQSVKRYIPNLDINSITVIDAESDTDNPTSISEDEDTRLFRASSTSTKPYTAKIKIDYTANNGAFGTSDFVIINI